MQRLTQLGKLSRTELFSVSQLLQIDKLSAEIQDDSEFLREVERRLPLVAQLNPAPTMWDELFMHLEDEPYVEQAERPTQFTKPLRGGRTSVTVGKWDITAASNAWLQSQKPILEKVGVCSGPQLQFVAETACCHRCTAKVFPYAKTEKS